jgi:hypothetical protein
VEANFWSLNALTIQPGYILWREALRHLAERTLGSQANTDKLARLRAASSAGAGGIVCLLSILVAAFVWPTSRWVGAVTDLLFVQGLIVPALANAVVVVSIYLSAASLVWGIADAAMGQPRDIRAFGAGPLGGRLWRVAHLSDLHVVGERYGFRIESGRAGPRGNDRLDRVLARLESVHSAQPLDLSLVTGNLTDTSRSTEWAEFLDLLARHPVIAERVVVLPGNHDVNIVDHANPARFNLPFSPGKRLRRIRALSALAAVQGDRVHVVDQKSGELVHSLADSLAEHQPKIEEFARTGSLRLSAALGSVGSVQNLSHFGRWPALVKRSWRCAA